MCKKENYKPRTKKYIYQVATKEEFEKYAHLKNKLLIENAKADKAPKVFYLCNDELGYKEKFDNQTAASKVCGISQAQISYMIKNGNKLNGWYCIYLDAIKYTEASSYQNLLDLINPIQLKNINTGEVLVFNTAKEISDKFNIGSHDIRAYIKTGHIFMNEWEMIEIIRKK